MGSFKEAMPCGRFCFFTGKGPSHCPLLWPVCLTQVSPFHGGLAPAPLLSPVPFDGPPRPECKYLGLGRSSINVASLAIALIPIRWIVVFCPNTRLGPHQLAEGTEDFRQPSTFEPD